MHGHGRRERAASPRRPPASWSAPLAAAVTALAVACTGPGYVSSDGSGHGASAGACGGPAAAAYFAGARMVFTGTMLPGRAADVGGHRVLVSPARVRVTRYLKGHGPEVVTVQTGVAHGGGGVTTASEDGIEPQAGQHWKIHAYSSRMPYDASLCGGSRPARKTP